MTAPRYREELLLGTGGMAEVWRAVGPEGVVALKRLLPHAARNPSLAAAFEREGRLLARIHHPNVVGIHDVVRDSHGIFLVLEYVEGADLRTLCASRVPAPIALRIARDVLCALGAVHTLCDEQGHPLGLIHRDLAPGNVLVGVDGRVKLTDFGIARALSGSHATTGQNIKGTLAYLSPEQATLAPIDARSDLFAVGALLYEMLTGAPIYDEDDPRLALARARAGDVHSVGAGRPDLPPSIVELVDRALAASPVDRFPSADVMRGELERAAEHSVGLASDAELASWAQSAAAKNVELAPAASPHFVGLGRSVAPPSNSGSTTTVVLPIMRSKPRTVVLGALVLALVSAGVYFGRRRAPSNAVQPAALLQADLAGPAQSGQPPPLEPAVLPAQGELVTPPHNGPDLQRSTASGARHSKSASRAPAALRVATARTPQAVGDDGLLDIGSEPGFAYVTIDGSKAGATPLFGRVISAGTHQIEVSREGLGSKTFTIEVKPGERVSRIVKLP
jgi:serine/threonine-protein kinase